MSQLSSDNVQSTRVINPSKLRGTTETVLQKVCGKVLKNLEIHPQGAYFFEPVNPLRCFAPGYFDVVKSPMDFSTIRHKLAQNTYLTAECFAADVRLTFRNAIIYNESSSHVINIAAKTLASKFETEFKAVLMDLPYYLDQEDKSKTPQQLKRPKYPARPQPTIVPTIDPEAQEVAHYRKEIDALKQKYEQQQVTGQEIDTRTRQDIDSNTLTVQEKKKLIADIRALPAGKQALVRKYISESLSSDDDSTVLDSDACFEISFDKICAEAINKIKRLLQGKNKATCFERFTLIASCLFIIAHQSQQKAMRGQLVETNGLKLASLKQTASVATSTKYFEQVLDTKEQLSTCATDVGFALNDIEVIRNNGYDSDLSKGTLHYQINLLWLDILILLI